MKRIPGVRRLLRLRAHGQRDVEREIDDEIASHLELRAESLVLRGMDRDEAQRESIRRFGDLDLVRGQLYTNARVREGRMQVREWIASLHQDARYALRQVRRTPGFAAAVAITIALIWRRATARRSYVRCFPERSSLGSASAASGDRQRIFTAFVLPVKEKSCDRLSTVRLIRGCGSA
jgi:hypothetical protein